MENNYSNNRINKSSLIQIILGIMLVFSLFVAPIVANADSSVYVNDQSGGQWTVGTPFQAKIFAEDYTSKDGKTVKTGKGDKVIAPGTSGTYTFTLHNNRGKSVDYRLEVAIANEDAIPVTLELDGKTGNNVSPPLGWTSEDYYYGTVSSGGQETFTLKWEWPFERGQDGDDTALGNKGTSIYKVRLNIKVYEEDEVVPPHPGATTGTSGSGDTSGTTGTSGTGDTSVTSGTDDTSGTHQSGDTQSSDSDTTQDSTNPSSSDFFGQDNYDAGNMIDRWNDYWKNKAWRTLPMTGEAAARSALVIGLVIIFIVIFIWKRRRKNDEEDQ